MNKMKCAKYICKDSQSNTSSNAFLQRFLNKQKVLTKRGNLKTDGQIQVGED